jgi:hypothetical protein
VVIDDIALLADKIIELSDKEATFLNSPGSTVLSKTSYYFTKKLNFNDSFAESVGALAECDSIIESITALEHGIDNKLWSKIFVVSF